MEQEVLTCQRGHHVFRNNGSREEETRERLSSLIRQKDLTVTGSREDTVTGGREDCYWVLLADSFRDRFVILEGVHGSCCLSAHNDDFHLVAVGNASGCEVFWPGAKDLACVVHKLMTRKKRNAANDSEAILKESAIRGLVIYHLVGCEARFRRPEDEFWVYIAQSSVASSLPIPSLEFEMQMLSRVLTPPSVLAAGSLPSLLARAGHLNNTASSYSYAPLGLVSVGIDNNPSEAASYFPPELPMIMATAVDTYTSGSPSMIMATVGDGNSTLGRNLVDLMQELAAAPPHSGFITRSSGGRGRNGGGGVPPALIEFLIRILWRNYDLEAQRRPEIFLPLANSNLEAGGQTHRVGQLLPAAAATTPVQEPPDIAKMLKGVMVQALAAFLPTCVTAYSQLNEAPDHIKFTTFIALGFITVGLFVGIVSRSVARLRLALRLVSFSAIALLTFGTASQFSSPTYIAFTALAGVAMNLLIMLLRF